MTYAGTRMARVEDTRLLTGHGTFVDDIVRPGMLHACFVRSPFARARISGIDASAAVALPGVVAVFTAADLNPDVREAWHAVAGKDIPDTPRPPLAEGEVKFVGDPVALVVAQQPVPRRGRRRAGRRRLRAAARRRRLHSSRRLRCGCARGVSGQRRGRHGRSAARRGDVLVGRVRGVGERVPADLRTGADRDARHGRRVGSRPLAS